MDKLFRTAKLVCNDFEIFVFLLFRNIKRKTKNTNNTIINKSNDALRLIEQLKSFETLLSAFSFDFGP